MKLRKVLPMLAVASFSLAACASKVDYKQFHEKATAVKAHEYTAASVKIEGKYSFLGASVEINDTVKCSYVAAAWLAASDNKAGEAATYVATALINVKAADVPEQSGAEYYAGGSFKVVIKDGDDKGTMQFNSFGLLTSIKSDDLKVSVSYSK